MNNNDEKKNIFNKIASLKTDINSKVKNSLQDSNEFIKNNETIQFLIDLLKTLEDLNAVKNVIIDSINNETEMIEQEIKQIIIKNLNDIVFCYSEAKIPDSFINEGITLPVDKIDFMKMLLIDPKTDVGRLIYMDIENMTNSTDFNTFLYYVINNVNKPFIWGPQMRLDPIMTLTFKAEQNNEFDVINFKINDRFSNKKFSLFIRELINSLDLVDTKTLLNSLYDSVTGTLSFNSNKTLSQITNQEEINQLITNITNDVNLDANIDDYFNFDTSTTQNLEDKINMKLDGVFSIDDAQNDLSGVLSLTSLTDVNNALNDLNDINVILSNALNSLGTIDLTETINQTNIPTINANMVVNIVKNLGVTLSNIIVSPKIVLPFMLALKFNGNDDISDVKTFIRKNGNVFKSLIKSINGIIINKLTDEVKKSITKLVNEKINNIKNEQLKNRKTQMGTLT